MKGEMKTLDGSSIASFVENMLEALPVYGQIQRYKEKLVQEFDKYDVDVHWDGNTLVFDDPCIYGSIDFRFPSDEVSGTLYVSEDELEEELQDEESEED